MSGLIKCASIAIPQVLHPPLFLGHPKSMARPAFETRGIRPWLVIPFNWALFAVFTSGFQSSIAAEPQTSGQSNDHTYEQIIERIDQLIEQGWLDNDLRPSKEASDAEWCRRVYLDVIGRVPTVKELRTYVSQRGLDKRRALVDRLLGSQYSEEYVRHWTSYWTNALIGRTGGRERRSITNRPSMESYLSESLAENKPYDVLVEELLTATGGAYPEAEDFNGAVNFLVEKMDENGVQATAKTAEIFLGTAVQCTQCHNHPFNEYRQNQFWELNAFFRQTRVARERDDDDNRRLGSLVNVNFAGEGRSSISDDRREIFLEMRNGKLVDSEQAAQLEAPLYYELRNGQVRVAYPVFVDGTTLKEVLEERDSPYGNSGVLDHVDRRAELARLVVSDRQFDRALVNRLWAYFFGHGFTKPFDDMGPHNPESHPELIEELGLAFRNSAFDLKSAIRWIVLSRPYALTSRYSRGNQADEPTEGVTPQFSRFYVRQMQPEQLYESLLVATAAEATVDAERREGMKDRWLRQFSTAFGTDDNSESSSFNGSITQVLTMMNGDLIERACSTGNGSFLDRVANDSSLSNREKIQHLYQAGLSRLPSKEETNLCNQLLVSRRGDVVGSLQDIWWAVLNSNEFILIH